MRNGTCLCSLVQVLRGAQLIAVASADPGAAGVEGSPLQANDIQVQYVQLAPVSEHASAVQVRHQGLHCHWLHWHIWDITANAVEIQITEFEPSRIAGFHSVSVFCVSAGYSVFVCAVFCMCLWNIVCAHVSRVYCGGSVMVSETDLLIRGWGLISRWSTADVPLSNAVHWNCLCEISSCKNGLYVKNVIWVGC